MDMDTAQVKAECYANMLGRSLDLSLLGFGQDGYLWATKNGSAIKVLERQSKFRAELECYQRLQQRKIEKIGRFNVPQLIGFNTELQVVEMSIVVPPLSP
jgi:hypothetical protein